MEIILSAQGRHSLRDYVCTAAYIYQRPCLRRRAGIFQAARIFQSSGKGIGDGGDDTPFAGTQSGRGTAVLVAAAALSGRQGTAAFGIGEIYHCGSRHQAKDRIHILVSD